MEPREEFVENERFPLPAAVVPLPLGGCFWGILASAASVGEFARLGFIFPYLFSGILPGLLITWVMGGRYWGWVTLLAIAGAHLGVCASNFFPSFDLIDCVPGLFLLALLLPVLQLWLMKMRAPVGKVFLLIGVIGGLTIARDVTERLLERSTQVSWSGQQGALLKQWQGWADEVLLPAYRVKLSPEPYDSQYAAHFSGRKGPILVEAWTSTDGQQWLEVTSESAPVRKFVAGGALFRISDGQTSSGVYDFPSIPLPPKPWILGGGSLRDDD